MDQGGFGRDFEALRLFLTLFRLLSPLTPSPLLPLSPRPLLQVFNKRMPPDAIDLISRLLQYTPSLRCTALEACVHPFFDEVRRSLYLIFQLIYPISYIPLSCPLHPFFDEVCLAWCSASPLP